MGDLHYIHLPRLCVCICVNIIHLLIHILLGLSLQGSRVSWSVLIFGQKGSVHPGLVHRDKLPMLARGETCKFHTDSNPEPLDTLALSCLSARAHISSHQLNSRKVSFCSVDDCYCVGREVVKIVSGRYRATMTFIDPPHPFG